MARRVKRRLIAVIDERTTVVCLDACGQVVDAHQPFHTLNGDMWEPPFHVNCRSIVAPFVVGVSDPMLKSAREELARRPASQFRRLPPKPRQGVATKTRDLFRRMMWNDTGELNVDAAVLKVGARTIKHNGVSWTTDGKSWWMGDRVPAKIVPGDERLVSNKAFADQLDEVLKAQSVPAPVVETVEAASGKPVSQQVMNIWDDEETEALHWWIDNDNWALSKALRDGDVPDGELKRVQSALDRAFSHAEYPENAPLYRGVTNVEDLGIKADDLKPGTVLQDRSYSSVTTQPQVAESYASGDELWDEMLEYYPDSKPAILEIRSPQGSKVIDNSTGFRATDSERLLDRGMKLRIVSVEDYKSVTALPDPPPGTVKKIVVEIVDEADDKATVAGRVRRDLVDDDAADVTKAPTRLSSWRLDEPMSTFLSRDRAGAEKWAADLGEDYVDAVRQGLPDGVTARLYGPARPSIVGKISVEVRVYEGEMEVGRIVRSIDVERGEIEHDLFKLRKGVRGKGIGRQVTEATMDLYRRMGMSEVKVHANIDVGGYAWARMGFTWDTAYMDRRSVMKLIRKTAERADDVPGMTAEWREETVAAADKMLMEIDDRWPEPAEVAMLGWRPGVETWPGKEGMLAEQWMGVRRV